jgi:processive 1,2-diacylglycerol beta-glucosyltransferase
MSMRRRADILILSSAIGSGHMRASAALSKGVKLIEPRRECLTVDFPREVSPAMEAILRHAYLESLKLMPDLYGRIYRMPELQATQDGMLRQTSEVYERVQRTLDLWITRHYDPMHPDSGYTEARRQRQQGVGRRTLEGLVEETGANVLVAPHFYGAGVLGNYKEQNPQAFTTVVLTDYVPHPIGVPSNLDLYVVADEAAAEMVEKLGVPEDKIHPTGIPIDPVFEDPADVTGVRRDVLELGEHEQGDDLPITSVMGGGLGGGHLENVVTSLLEASAAIRLVVLCGSNTSTCERLQRIAEIRGRSATFLPFTDRVRDLMAASTVLVTKPGGMSCTEALALGLPQILFNPIPGQEEDNAAAMMRYGAGVMVNSVDDVLGETLKVLTSPNHRRRMVESAHAAHRPHSARAAAELILQGTL